MSSYLDFIMYGNNNLNAAKNMYEQQIAQYQQQLAQLQQNSPYNRMPAYQPPQVFPQQPVMQQTQQPRDDLYLQSLFMEFLRSPEMKDFTDTFYSKFSIFYKNKTGLDYNGNFYNQNNMVNNTPQTGGVAIGSINPVQQAQVQQPQQVQQTTQPEQKYIIE